jgi:hypothetical protein
LRSSAFMQGVKSTNAFRPMWLKQRINAL